MARRDNPRDGFFSKVLVATIVVIWVALVGGNWIGHLAIQSGVLGKTEDVKFKVNEPRPKPWVTVDARIQKELERSTGMTPKADVTPATPTEAPSVSLTSTPLEPTGEPTPLAETTPATPELRTPQAPPATPAAPEPPAATPLDEQTPTAPEATPALTTGSGEFQLQFGSFGSQENAQRLADELKRKGQQARVEEIRTANGPVFRVRGGTYSESAAHEQMEKLKGQNVDAYIVNP